jgi:hypothetical protein
MTYCTHCGTIGESKRFADESWLVAFALLLMGLIPGVIYIVWSHSRAYRGCRCCKSRQIVPLDSPAGRQALAMQEANRRAWELQQHVQQRPSIAM